MKADYKNWMPKGMVLGTIGITAAIFFVAVIVGIRIVDTWLRIPESMLKK